MRVRRGGPLRELRRGGRSCHHIRQELERRGWRTLLAYQENQLRADDGTLVAVAGQWVAEAEHADHPSLVASVTAGDPDEAWAKLRHAARVSGRPRSGVRS